MKNFTRISLLFSALVISGSAFAQLPYKHINPNRSIDASTVYDSKKGTSVSRQSFTMYFDYSTANSDDKFFLWGFNSLYTGIDTAMNYVGVSLDEVAGYTDPSDPPGSMQTYASLGLPVAYPTNLVITVDSVYVFLAHENNSAQYDYMTLKLLQAGSNGAPTTNVLWQQTDSTDTSLSPGGNWLGTNALYVKGWAPNYTTTAGQKVHISFEYYDLTKTDSLGILAGFVNNGSNGADNPSAYKNSYMRYPPMIPSITKTSSVGYGNPVGSQGWVECQNWIMYALVHFDYNVGINDVNNNLSFVSLTPNPAQNFVRANIALAKSSNVTATLSDVTGRVIATVFNGNLSSGKNFITINTSDLASGIYFVNIKADNGNVVSTRVVVTK